MIAWVTQKRLFEIILKTAVCIALTGVLRAGVILFMSPGTPKDSDFGLFHDTVQCVRAGVNPYRVYVMEVEHPVFFSQKVKFGAPSPQPPPPHARWVFPYTPWGYTFMMPMTILPLVPAYYVWLLLTVLFLALAVRWSYRRAMERFGDRFTARRLALAGIAFYALSLAVQLRFENLAALHLATALGLIGCLNRSEESQGCRARTLWQMGAGLCWAVLMMKPQLGLLAFFPLLFSRKWLAMVSAVAFCLAGAVPSALLCGESFADLVIQSRAGGVAYYMGSLLLPKSVMGCLGANALPDMAEMLPSMILGAALCAVFSWRVRHCKDWAVKTVPWLALAPAWTFAWDYDTALWVIPVTVFLLDSWKGWGCVMSRVRMAGFALFVTVAWLRCIITPTTRIQWIVDFARQTLGKGGQWGWLATVSDHSALISDVAMALHWIPLAMFFAWLWKFKEET